VKVDVPFRGAGNAWLLRLDETRMGEMEPGEDGWMELPTDPVCTVEIPLSAG
jgi:hypothetical protein